MIRRLICSAIALLFSLAPSAGAEDDPPLRIFGYFQNSFQHQDSRGDSIAQSHNSFVLQQLNFFMQKDITDHWSAFLDFEVVNSFSSKLNWGDFSIEQAWVKYRYDNRLNLKLGLQIPTFNHFNEIKNRAPLLPYIVKPLVYDASLAEEINLDVIIPSRAFVQAYGFLPMGRAKLDYAVYLGNSPNISSDPEKFHTGVDTTNTFLVGGRVGLRLGELKLGFSSTYDKDNSFADARLDSLLGLPPGSFSELGRARFGVDLLYRLGAFSFEGEMVSVQTEKVHELIDIDFMFYYATLGAQLNDRLFVYGSFWATDEDFWLPLDQEPGLVPVDPRDPRGRALDTKFYIPTGGISYAVNDRLTVKAQAAHVKQDLTGQDLEYTWKSHYYALGISVFF